MNFANNNQDQELQILTQQASNSLRCLHSSGNSQQNIKMHAENLKTLFERDDSSTIFLSIIANESDFSKL